MCLEVRTKQNKNSIHHVKSMWYVFIWERHIIQNGRQNEVEVNMYVGVTVPIATSYKENKSCHGGKKGGVTEIFSVESAMKWISKNLPYGRW